MIEGFLCQRDPEYLEKNQGGTKNLIFTPQAEAGGEFLIACLPIKNINGLRIVPEVYLLLYCFNPVF